MRVLTLALGLRFAITFLLVVVSRIALADWTIAGAQFLCDQKHQVFQLIPSDQNSWDVGTVNGRPGFKRLKTGDSNLICRVGAYSVQAKMFVWSPGGNNCEAAGGVRIKSIRVNGVELFPQITEFNQDCNSGPPLQKIEVHAEAQGVSLKKCFVTRPGRVEAPKEECNSTAIHVALHPERQKTNIPERRP